MYYICNTIKNPKAMKSWYAIKKKSEKRWVAYEINDKKIKLLKSNYEYKGPFKTLSAALCDSIIYNDVYYPNNK